LSIDNSNVKAHQLSAGKVSEKIDAILEAVREWLGRLENNPVEPLAAKVGRKPDSTEKDRRALRELQAIALDLHRQLAQNIYDTGDEAMDRLDEQVAIWEKDADARLAELSAVPENEDLQSLKILSGGFRELKPLVSQMRKLLRANTNAQSFRLTEFSNPKLDDCRAALTELDKILRHRMKSDLEAISDITSFTQWLMILVPLIGILASVMLAIVIAKSITTPLGRGVEISAAIAD
jgi:hypothetical protein